MNGLCGVVLQSDEHAIKGVKEDLCCVRRVLVFFEKGVHFRYKEKTELIFNNNYVQRIHSPTSEANLYAQKSQSVLPHIMIQIIELFNIN